MLHIHEAEEIAEHHITPESEPEITSAKMPVARGIGKPQEMVRQAHHGGDEAIFYIEVEKIKPNPHQPRRHFDENSIKELAASVREFGIIQPLVVSKVVKEVPTGTEVEYELIAGERRLMAAKLLGLATVPAIVRNVNFDRERLELAMIENIQRENLNPIELARAFGRLQDDFRMTQREVASRLGKSRETVANTLRLLELPSEIQIALEKGELSESHGRFLLAVTDPAARDKLFRDILARGMTVRELKHRAELISPKKSRAGSGVSPELQMLKEKLASDLGAPVEVSQNGETGKITIVFYSNEELKNIVDKLGGET